MADPISELDAAVRDANMLVSNLSPNLKHEQAVSVREAFERIYRAVDARMTPAAVAGWMDGRGYCAIERGGGVRVTLYNYDAEPGVVFERPSLHEACALADRFQREVPSADDVGDEESQRAVEAWLRANDPENAAARARPASEPPAGDER